ncbi:Acyl CoA binding protein, putative [Plasmodium yoelii yoelii]|uniref:Acyl CoA binding protein, putative n=1 Tax=Plasmodium yoelii yoelii TaxID=73239 RepID=Q7RP05_PLAYO|nr:Acyl CoA binding protein, putative [Plasmodium yoelii yoelii]
MSKLNNLFYMYSIFDILYFFYVYTPVLVNIHLNTYYYFSIFLHQTIRYLIKYIVKLYLDIYTFIIISSLANMSDLFDKCVSFVNSLPKTESISMETKLDLYKYYKQSMFGPCNIDAPSFFKFEEKKKYEAWKSLEGLSKDDAKAKYVEIVTSLYPEWNKS